MTKSSDGVLIQFNNTFKEVNEEYWKEVQRSFYTFYFVDNTRKAIDHQKRLLDGVLKYEPTIKNILIIGARGSGGLISWLKSKGYVVDGWDLVTSPDIEFHDLETDDTLEAYGKYDLIVAFAIFEHLLNDYRAMRQCNKYLKDGGLILVESPFVCDSNDGKEYHIRGYTPIGLAKMLFYAGFIKFNIHVPHPESILVLCEKGKTPIPMFLLYFSLQEKIHKDMVVFDWKTYLTNLNII